jgi:hypothetical protein
MAGFRCRLLTFCLPYNLLAQFLDQNGNKPYKLKTQRLHRSAREFVCEW